jgi:hypothetical protein
MRRVVIGWAAAAAVFACGGLCAPSASAYVWSPSAADAIPSGGLNPNFPLVSCVDATDCTAISGGDPTFATVPTVDQEVGGEWQTPEALAGFASYLALGDYVSVSGLDCVDAEDCIAVGEINPPTSDTTPTYFSLSEEGGVWGDPDPIGQGLGEPLVNWAGGVTGTVSCSSESDCVVVGSYESASGTTLHAVAAFGTISGFGGVSEDIPDEVFNSVGCVPGGTTCTAAGFTTADEGDVPEAIAQSETDGDWSAPDTLTSGTGQGLGWEGASIACPTAGACTVVGLEPSPTYDEPAAPFAVQEDDFFGDWDAPVTLGDDGATYGGLLMGALGCVSAGNCVIGGENASGAQAQAIFAQESDGAWAGFDPSPLPSDASTDEGIGSQSAAVGCDNASELPDDESPVCTVLGSYTNTEDTAGPYEFTDDLQGTLVEVTSVTPSVGPAGGGETLTITGTGFGSPGDADTVDFVAQSDGQAIAGDDAVVDSNTEITVTTPDVSDDPSNPDGSDLDPDGTLATDVEVVTPDNGSSGQNPPQDAYTFEPWITSVSPDQGLSTGGNTITITGSGFGATGSADSVAFVSRGGGAPLQATSVTVQNDTTITATVPSATNLFGPAESSVATDVVVTNAGGATTPVVADQSEYTFDDVWVDSVSPADGRLAGGEQVTVTGTGFGSAGDDDTVTFTPQGGGTPVDATDVTVLSDTELTATTPDMSTSTGDASSPLDTDVQVTNMGGAQSPATAADEYTFNPVAVNTVSPASGPAPGGNVVVIFGTGFGNPGDTDTVEFVPQNGDTPLAAPEVTVINDTTLTATVPDASDDIDAAGDDLTTDVQVATPGNGESALNPADDEYTFSPLSVDDLSVGTGPATGSTPIVIDGSGFGDPGAADTVQFVPQNGSAPIPATDVTVVNGTTIDAVTPDALLEMPAKGNLFTDVQVTTADGTSSELNPPVDVFQFTPVTAGPLVDSVTPASVTFGAIPKTFTIIGSGFTGATSVEFQLSNGQEIKVAPKSFTVNTAGSQIVLTKPTLMLLRLWFKARKLTANYVTDVRVVLAKAVSPINAPGDQVTFAFPTKSGTVAPVGAPSRTGAIPSATPPKSATSSTRTASGPSLRHRLTHKSKVRRRRRPARRSKAKRHRNR